MSLRTIETDCPSCKAKVPVKVELPEAKIVEDTSRVESLTHERDRLQTQIEKTMTELESWQSMEKHLPVPQILEHLTTCPNCQPQMHQFVEEVASKLPSEKVKELARKHGLWPPPNIDLTPITGRRAGRSA